MKKLIFALLLVGCTPNIPTTSTTVVQQAPTKPCLFIGEKFTLRNGRAVDLPQKGLFVLESHLATKEDSFASGRLFPQTNTEAIDAHLKRSCALLGKKDCSAVYASKYVKQWTPPEGGKAGQGAVGDLKPSAADEMFSGNMYWPIKPKPGTKYIAMSDNGKAVVVIVGYETGPKDSKYLGGLQGEVFDALGVGSEKEIFWGKAVDQTLKPGPLLCN